MVMSEKLNALRDKMSPEQRQEMAELIANELNARKNRGSGKAMSNNVSYDELNEIYKQKEEILNRGSHKPDNSMNKTVFSKTSRKLHRGMNFMSSKSVVLFGAIVFFAVCKIVLSFNDADAKKAISTDTQPRAMLSTELDEPAVAEVITESQNDILRSSSSIDRRHTGWSQQEHDLLTQLDSRRVELEKRKVQLDEREANLQAQEEEFVARISELKSLNRKISAIKEENSKAQESRIEQLASVYGSMDPNEAASLISKLDEDIALALLQRMPDKRMGQILSLMERSRAIELTKSLTNGGGV
jgi:flagellar motility protein MotE (MotC chaperone)